MGRLGSSLPFRRTVLAFGAFDLANLSDDGFVELLNPMYPCGLHDVDTTLIYQIRVAQKWTETEALIDGWRLRLIVNDVPDSPHEIEASLFDLYCNTRIKLTLPLIVPAQRRVFAHIFNARERGRKLLVPMLGQVVVQGYTSRDIL